MQFKNIFTAFLILTGTISFAQQDWSYASEGQRNFWFNPASIGTYNSYSINTVGKMDWVKVNSAPRGLQLNGALKCLRIGDTENPFSYGAVGVNYKFETISVLTSHHVSVPINTQFKLKGSYLSIGVSPGINSIEFEGGWVPPTTDPDPVIDEILSSSQTKFTTGAGVQWFGKNFSIGLASTHLFNERFEKIGYQSLRVFYLNGSYRKPLSDKFALGAVFTGRTAQSFSSAQGIISAIFGAKNELSFGLGYRSRNSFIASVAKRYNNFYLGYFATYNNSQLSGGSFGHEVRIAFELFDSKL